MKKGGKILIRISAALFYLIFFLGTYLTLHIYLANPSTVQEGHQYNSDNVPAYFPVLIMDQNADGTETLTLRSIGKNTYSRAETEEQSWRIFKTIGASTLANSPGVSYIIASAPQQLPQVEINVREANGQRISRYSYEINGNRILPRSHLILSSFGQNFSPIPFLMIFTGLLIFLSEKFLLRRLLNSSSTLEQKSQRTHIHTIK